MSNTHILPDCPLGVLPDAPLSQSELSLFRRIEDYQLPFVEEKLLAAGKISSQDMPLAIREFKRYIAILCTAPETKSLAVASPIVDDVWHQFILFTRKYAEFCDRVVGRFLHHMPRTSYTPVPADAGSNLVHYYERYFGSLHPLWYRSNSREEVIAGDCSTSTASSGSTGTDGND